MPSLSLYHYLVNHSNNRAMRRQAGMRRPATHTYATERIAAYGVREARRIALKRRKAATPCPSDSLA